LPGNQDAFLVHLELLRDGQVEVHIPDFNLVDYLD
jgi:hypothetical protein